MPIQTEKNPSSIQKMIPVNLFLNEWKETKINVKFVLAFESCTENKLMATMTLTHFQLITLFYELDKISKLENFYFSPDKLLSLLDTPPFKRSAYIHVTNTSSSFLIL